MSSCPFVVRSILLGQSPSQRSHCSMNGKAARGREDKSEDLPFVSIVFFESFGNKRARDKDIADRINVCRKPDGRQPHVLSPTVCRP